MKKVVDAREVWRREDEDFSTWLVKNLELLDEILGTELELIRREQPVGSFFADILCVDRKSNNSLVVIENQLGRSDHDHLGKLLTYATGLQAPTAIWIATAFEHEHLNALVSLNRRTNNLFRGFGVKLELKSIDNSKCLPTFTLVAEPRVRTQQRRDDRSETTDGNPAASPYWSAFRELRRECMKITRFLTFRLLPFILVCTSISTSAFASIWESGKIVYTSQSFGDLDIYSMGPHGDDKTRLTSSATDDYDPAWSPNGQQIVFVSDRSGQPDLYIMDDDGSNKERIRIFSKHRTSPTWAPDGERIAYSLNLEEIYIWDFVLGLPEFLVAGANPAWSPDGRYIAFLQDGAGSGASEGASLYVIDLETRWVRKLVDGSLLTELSDPTWGPQSIYIVFSWVDTFGDSGIYYVPRWGGGARRMNYWEGYHLHHPDISPYGGEMLLEAHPDDYTQQHIYKVTRRTNHWQRLTSLLNSTYNYDPDWWYPTTFPVEQRDSQFTTTWGELKKIND